METTPKVFIQPDFGSRCTNIFILEEKLTGFINYNIDEHGNIVKIEIKNSEEAQAKPLLKLPIMLMELLFKAILEYLENKGIKTKDENLIEGKLLATEKHLEDMREMSRKLLDTFISPLNVITSENGSRIKMVSHD